MIRMLKSIQDSIQKILETMNVYYNIIILIMYKNLLHRHIITPPKINGLKNHLLFRFKKSFQEKT